MLKVKSVLPDRTLLISALITSFALNIIFAWRVLASRGMSGTPVDTFSSARNLDAGEMNEIARGVAISAGPIDAQTVVVLFTDFQCSFCKQIAAKVMALAPKRLANERIIIRELPIGRHRYARKEAELAMCANEQSSAAAWALYDLFYFQADQQSDLTPNAMRTLESRSDIKIETLESCVNSHKSATFVDADIKLAKKIQCHIHTNTICERNSVFRCFSNQLRVRQTFW